MAGPILRRPGGGRYTALMDSSAAPQHPTWWVVCLCAAWCGVCREWQPTFAAQARAHACPADSSTPCHDLVRDGKVTITRVDPGTGGAVEGSFELTFADGEVSGSFSAVRCN